LRAGSQNEEEMRHTVPVLLLVLAGAGVATVYGCANSAPDPVVPTSGATDVVITTNGAVRGLVTDHREYRRIPYATPPVGDLRWKPPTPPRRWRGVRDATVFGNACSQMGYSGPNSDENCLTLNVYAPLRGDGLPVMVWFHGGMFSKGTASNYDASLLATKENVVVVTTNYRLGVLGFLATPALAAESMDGSVGNYGLMDQQLALRWVRDNIARFGGDPDNVTIFGESAGGASVCLHLISPGSAGLFHRAIIQSGPCTFMTRTAEASYQAGMRVVEEAGCTNSNPEEEMECMRDLSTEPLVKAGAEVSMMSATIDGVTVPGLPVEMVRAGTFNHVPVLLGNNAFEGRLFAYSAFDEKGAPLTADQYPIAVAALQGEDAAAVLEEYPLSKYQSPTEAYAAIIGDSQFSCEGRALIRQLVAQGVPVFAYEFSDPDPPAFMGKRLGPSHATELVYVFQTPLGSADSTGLSSSQMELSDQIQAYWANFARTGDPNGRGLPEWSPYSLDEDNYLELTSEPPGPHPTTEVSARHHCAFWDRL